MKCPYPDCNGQITAEEQFCGECGRSLAAEAVNAALGLPTGQPPQGAILSGTPPAAWGGSGAPPPPPTPVYPPTGASGPTAPLSGYGPAPVPPYNPVPVPVAAPPKKGVNPLLIVAGVVGLLVLSCVACLSLSIFSVLGTPTPTTETFVFSTQPPLITDDPTATTGGLTRATPTVEDVGLRGTPTAVSDTSTGTPTAGTPTTGPDLLEIVSFDNYVDVNGYVNIFGLVRNAAGVPLENIKLVGEVRDAQGNTVGTAEDGFLGLALLEPNQVAPYQIVITEFSGQGDSVNLLQQATPYDPEGIRVFTVAKNLRVEGDSLSNAAGGNTVTGQVKNGGTVPATLVEVLLTGYGAGGQIVDVTHAFSQVDPLDPGATAPFEATFNRTDVTVVKYDIMVVGLEK